MGSSDPIMRFFEYGHLPDQIRQPSKMICEMARELDNLITDGPEKAAGMRKLLEAKDALVRACLPPK